MTLSPFISGLGLFLASGHRDQDTGGAEAATFMIGLGQQGHFPR
jgi:hypothetical protein